MTPIASTDCRPELLAILREARSLLARPENDFADSGWICQESALGELDWFLYVVRGGLMPCYPQVAKLFSLGGPIEEVASRSGWTDDYLDVASRFAPLDGRCLLRIWGLLRPQGEMCRSRPSPLSSPLAVSF